MNVLLICGGQSSEHEVSRMSATNIKTCINKKYNIKTLGITKDGSWYELDDNINDFRLDNWLDNSKEIKNIIEYLREFDCVFPILHGKHGEDGSIQGLFELSGIPYVGMHVLGSSLAMDKVYTKKILNTASINQTPSIYIKKKYNDEFIIVSDDQTEMPLDINYIENILNFPVFVKASNQGSSVGCFKANKNDFLEKLNEASKYDRKILVEKAINARELEVAVLGNDDVIVSDVGEILPHGEFYTYDSKYNDEESKTKIPADINEDDKAYIQEMAKRAFKALDGHGMSRCDFFLDKDTGVIYLNEVNTIPGFTNISMYPKLMENFGIPQEELIDKLIELAIETK